MGNKALGPDNIPAILWKDPIFHQLLIDLIITYRIVKNEQREDLHEFLRAYTDIFSKNVYMTKDMTFANLRSLIKNDELAIIQGDKDSCVVIMNKTDYVRKIQEMINVGIRDGIYTPCEDDTISELKRFQDFLYRNFKDHKYYEKMFPSSNQPARLYGTAKTHKFEHLEDITLEDLKFRPIIAQTGTYTYNCAQVIGNYLKPLINENDYIIHNTQEFAKILREQQPLQPNEEYVSYDVESLFTNVPVIETIDFILDEIYVHNKLPKLCSRLIFKRLLLRLTTESTFIFQSSYYKQTDGCTMGGPYSVIFSNICLTKLEREKVKPLNPPFYKRFVDDVINKRIKGQTDVMFENINNFHPKINFTVEVNPEKFLDTKIKLENGNVTTEVYRKPRKFPPPWSSHIPKRYKRNIINGDLNRAYRISTNFEQEKTLIKAKFCKANYPFRYVQSVVKQFEDRLSDNCDYIIPPDFFDEPTPTATIEIPFCEKNEQAVKPFLKKLDIFTKGRLNIRVIWKTKKVKQLFSLKDKNPYPACIIYEGQCTCGTKYIGETKRNAIVRWSEHNNPLKDSEPSRHLRDHLDHVFQWKIVMSAPYNFTLRKNLEASWIAMKRPPLNEQVISNKLYLFRNGVT